MHAIIAGKRPARVQARTLQEVSATETIRRQDETGFLGRMILPTWNRLFPAFLFLLVLKVVVKYFALLDMKDRM
jgi:hypothetical protein